MIYNNGNIGNTVLEGFSSDWGDKQGDNYTSLLFNLVIYTVLEKKIEEIWSSYQVLELN